MGVDVGTAQSVDAGRSQWMWDAVSGCGTQAVTIIYSIQTGQYSGELSANFD